MKNFIKTSNNNAVIDFESAFSRLNEELSDAGLFLNLVCAGGYVMQLHGFIATADVDAFYESNEKIESIIRTVGDEFGINKADELWLNSSIADFNDMPPGKYCKVKYKLSNLMVKVVDILYVIGMKLDDVSARDKDLKHVSSFIIDTNNEQPLELFSELTRMGFRIDISVLLETYGIAYGMDWLEKFYEENYTEIEKYS